MSGVIDLSDVIAKVDISVLIGLSTAPNSFNESIVREMSRKIRRPVILPRSNPTEKSEAKPYDLICWSGGRAIVATGSPFAPVQYEGRNLTIAQCNNTYIFPAVGLGVVASQACRITDSMMMVAAHALAGSSPAIVDPWGPLLPPLAEIRKSSLAIAVAVAEEAQNDGVAPAISNDELLRRVQTNQWMPRYD